MAWYEDPIFTSLLSIIIIIITIIMPISIRVADLRIRKKEIYTKHIKELVNLVYNGGTRNGKDLAEPNFYGVISNNPRLLQHCSTSKPFTIIAKLISQIREERKDPNRDKTKEEADLKKQLTNKFLELHTKISQDIDPEFGFCEECVGKKTIFPFLSKRKLKNFTS